MQSNLKDIKDWIERGKSFLARYGMFIRSLVLIIIFVTALIAIISTIDTRNQFNKKMAVIEDFENRMNSNLDALTINIESRLEKAEASDRNIADSIRRIERRLKNVSDQIDIIASQLAEDRNLFGIDGRNNESDAVTQDLQASESDRPERPRPAPQFKRTVQPDGKTIYHKVE